MESSSSVSPRISDIPSKKSSKTASNSGILSFNKKPSKLPEKDKKFVEELLKKNSNALPQNSKPLVLSSISETSSKIRAISQNPARTKHLNKTIKSTTSTDFKDYENLKHISLKHSGTNQINSVVSLEKNNLIDTSYKFFVGNGNNDSLVRKILNSKPGWVKTFSQNTANLIWTEVKQINVYDLIPSFAAKPKKNADDKGSVLDAISALSNDILKNKIYNKLEGNKELSSKKRLFANMNSYYKSIGDNPFKYIPLTVHIVEGVKDPCFKEFVRHYKNFQKQMVDDQYLNNLWLVKPGESTNRGIGITVCGTIEEVSKSVEEKKSNGSSQRTYIVQKYLYKPMLYKNRKFDIRCYVLMTSISGKFQAYFYKEGYLRTSCQEFSMENIHEKYIHLTNDAVQKKSPDYGKFEDGNKLSYQEFQDYINENLENKANFSDEVYPKMKKIVLDTVKATYKKLDTKKRWHTFEVFGYDFMLDEMYSPWLLEINTNPCLALSGAYLATLIPKMLTHAFEIALDQIFCTSEPVESQEANNFELIFTKKNLL